jgi:hypothetical protein
MGNGMKPEIAAFSALMESRLKENAKRGDWHGYNFYYLITSLVSNLGTLTRAFEMKNQEVLLRSAADTANYAMMIAELFGELTPKRR